jgi:hyperosmotically inducible protein
MFARTLIVAAATSIAALTALTGCAVTRGQETVGEYIDDATITTRIKAKYAEAPSVGMTSINVQTLNGEVILSGFAKNTTEKVDAERLARDVKGVKKVRNEIAVRP